VKRNFFFILVSIILLWGCEEKNNGVVLVKESNAKEKPDPYVEWNKMNVNREEEDIDFFVKRYGWEMQKLGIGLRIQVLDAGQGDLIKSEDVVTLKYTTLLLTGDTVYSSAKEGEKIFKVDKSEEIVGLHEAVKMMKKGGRARLVIPSFLAYGIAGDGVRIRGKASLAMQIEIVDVHNK